MELAGGLTAVAAFLAAPSLSAAAAAWLLLLALIAIFLIDLDHRLILDVITLPGIALGLLFCPCSARRAPTPCPGVAGGWLVLEGAPPATGAGGDRGLGGGDVKLAAMLGAGWAGRECC
ncbi:MAG: prepilin peptidase [bacterium]|nr:prepilin peptidase [bacterium]